jgi:MarR family transcriptional regulator, lower aerobic nicotinate degradation pathway regulator
VRRLVRPVVVHELMRRGLDPVTVDGHQHVAVCVLGALGVAAGPAKKLDHRADAAQLTASRRVHLDVLGVDPADVLGLTLVEQAGKAGEELGDLEPIGELDGLRHLGLHSLTVPMLVEPTIVEFVGDANGVTVEAVEGVPDRLSSKPTWLLTQLAIRARRLVEDANTHVGAGAYHYRVLAAVQQYGAMSQADLARRGHLDRSDVVGAVNELAAQGFVERMPDPNDRRRNIVRLTKSGATHLRRMDRVLDLVQDGFLAPLSAEERQILRRLLTRLLDHQRSRESAPG